MTGPRDPEARAARRVVDALDEMRAAAKALGLDADAIGELHVPWQLRADAWLYRTACLVGDRSPVRRRAA